MARKQFLIIYPDGSKKHIGSFEREQMLLAGELRQLAPQHYKFIGEIRTFHVLADLKAFIPELEPRILRRYYPGSFIVELKGKKRFELMESPEAMAVRITGRSELS